MTEPDTNKPKVLIVGAGLGGLLLAILLERAGVPYEVLERAAAIKPLGAAISLGSNILHVFNQLGLLDEFLAFSKPSVRIFMCNQERGVDYVLEQGFVKDMGGFHGTICTRKDLYDLLLRQIPSSKVHLSKKMISFDQTTDSNVVTVQCADGSSYVGDILVGADGAYSTVRECLYKELEAQGTLPKGDSEPLPFNSVLVLGTTNELSPEEFPELNSDESNPQIFLKHINGVPYTWIVFPMKGNTFCWGVTEYLNEYSTKQEATSSDKDWGPKGAEAMCNLSRDFPIRGGLHNTLTIGDMIDRTPKELISKVMLEEKVFDTWYGGRVVLLGDACHKMIPSGAQGAVNAMQDAVALANWISVLEKTSSKDGYQSAWKEYQDERHPLATQSFEVSQFMGKQTLGNWVGTVSRLFARYMPDWFQKFAMMRMISNRPQVSFLPPAEDKGTVPVIDQPSLRKTKAMLAGSQARS
ncbi:hypothetical protein BCR41DRAFT_426043 [Lobosporangium transversale]|uniref:FAD-binding domain-containing protein n=1 Tax=Lobosporangium transversale TaxID=64571 RepID=A0A1Y2GB10_9FUNG|nr:hypothetical protein BCR41DRAFT_426043 [Lobosporangium transversale]ORZ04202.1 hypothetical protein BCR41DRAFT_426043 [Lobosporangium transversale]|eukprot:XP_021876416.1 hypothetical protein BCR41DRAFT_426043 [Lobosporangium transversale]